MKHKNFRGDLYPGDENFYAAFHLTIEKTKNIQMKSYCYFIYYLDHVIQLQ